MVGIWQVSVAGDRCGKAELLRRALLFGFVDVCRWTTTELISFLRRRRSHLPSSKKIAHTRRPRAIGTGGTSVNEDATGLGWHQRARSE